MRGALALARTVKTWAIAHGRTYVTPDDVRDLAVPVLAHRIIVDPESEFAGVTAEDIVATRARRGGTARIPGGMTAEADVAPRRPPRRRASRSRAAGALGRGIRSFARDPRAARRGVPSPRSRRPSPGVVSTTGWLVLGGAVVALALAWAFGWVEFAFLGFTLLAAVLVSIAFVFGRMHYRVDIELQPRRVVAGERALGRLVVENVGHVRRRRRRGWSCPSAPGSPSSSIPALAARRASTRSCSPCRPTGVPSSSPGPPCRCAATSSACCAAPCAGPTPSSSSCTRARRGCSPRRPASFATSRARSRRRSPNNDISFHALRAYEPGDALRNVHWRTSARTGQLMVRQYEETRRSQLVLAAVDRARALRLRRRVRARRLGARLASACRSSATARSVDVVTEGLALRTATPTALLDDTSRIEPVRRRVRLTCATSCATPPSGCRRRASSIVVGGSPLPLADFRSVETLFGPDTQTLAFRVELGAASRIARIAGTTVVTVGDLDRAAAARAEGAPVNRLSPHRRQRPPRAVGALAARHRRLRDLVRRPQLPRRGGRGLVVGTLAAVAGVAAAPRRADDRAARPSPAYFAARHARSRCRTLALFGVLPSLAVAHGARDRRRCTAGPTSSRSARPSRRPYYIAVGAVLRRLARGARRHDARDPVAAAAPHRAAVERAAHRPGAALPVGHPARHRRGVPRRRARRRVRDHRPRLARLASRRRRRGERRRRGAPAAAEGRRHGGRRRRAPSRSAPSRASPSRPSSPDRFVLRDEIVPPFDPLEFPSPLAGFRNYTKDLAETPLFTVTGLEPGDVDPARHDGRVHRPTLERGRPRRRRPPTAAATASSARRCPSPSSQRSAARATSRSRSTAYDDVWLPTVGYGDLAAAHRRGTSAARGRDLRYNAAAGTAVLTSGIAEGARYRTRRARSSRSPRPSELHRHPGRERSTLAPVENAARRRRGEGRGVRGRGDEPDRAAARHRAGAEDQRLPQPRPRLRHGASRAGHGADRIIELFTRTQMVGDEEQYAVRDGAHGPAPRLPGPGGHGLRARGARGRAGGRGGRRRRHRVGRGAVRGRRMGLVPARRPTRSTCRRSRRRSRSPSPSRRCASPRAPSTTRSSCSPTVEIDETDDEDRDRPFADARLGLGHGRRGRHPRRARAPADARGRAREAAPASPPSQRPERPPAPRARGRSSSTATPSSDSSRRRRARACSPPARSSARSPSRASPRTAAPPTPIARAARPGAAVDPRGDDRPRRVRGGDGERRGGRGSLDRPRMPRPRPSRAPAGRGAHGSSRRYRLRGRGARVVAWNAPDFIVPPPGLIPAAPRPSDEPDRTATATTPPRTLPAVPAAARHRADPSAPAGRRTATGRRSPGERVEAPSRAPAARRLAAARTGRTRGAAAPSRACSGATPPRSRRPQARRRSRSPIPPDPCRRPTRSSRWSTGRVHGHRPALDQRHPRAARPMGETRELEPGRGAEAPNGVDPACSASSPCDWIELR